MKNAKKLLAVLMAVIMVFGIMPPIMVSAEQNYDDEIVEAPYYVDEASYYEEEPSDYVDEALKEQAAALEFEGAYAGIVPFSGEPMLSMVASPRTAAASQDSNFVVDFAVNRLPAMPAALGWNVGYFYVHYDPAVVEFVAVVPHPDTPFNVNWGTARICIPGSVPGRVTIESRPLANFLVHTDVILSLEFRALANAADGTTVIRPQINHPIQGFAGNDGVNFGIDIPVRPMDPATDYARVWVGEMQLIVTVEGPAYADIVVTHGATVFTQDGRVFTAVSSEPLTGTVTASAVGFLPNTGEIPAYGADGIARMTIVLTPPVSPPHLGTLVGRVTNATGGAGIGGATVTVVTATGTVDVLTNAAGYYIVTHLEPGEVVVSASAAGFNAGFYLGNPATITASATTTANVALQARTDGQDGYTLFVIVRGPAANAVISVTHPDAVFTRSANTTVFTATTANPLTGNVSVTSSGFNAATPAVPAYDANNIAIIDITLTQLIPPPGYGIVYGYVTRAANGTPIDGAVVELVNELGVTVRSTTTSASGYYVFLPPVPVGNYRVVAALAPYIPASRDVVVVDQAWTRADFALARGVDGHRFTLVVNLVNIDGAPATVVRNNVPMPFVNGVWTESGVWPVIGTVQAAAVGFWPSAVYTVTNDCFDANGVFVLNITLREIDETNYPTPIGMLRGFVRQDSDRATPIPNATVTAIHADGTRSITTTNALGFYYFENLPSGTYTVLATAPGFNANLAQAILTDQNGAQVNVYLEAGGFMQHMLIVNVEPDDAIAGANVTFAGQSLNHLAGNTWYMVLPMALDGNVQVTSAGFITGNRAIDANNDFVNRIAHVTVRLTRVAVEGTLQGYVIEASTSPANRLPNAQVRVVNTETGATFTTQTNSEGFFRFENLPFGSYTVVAWADGFDAAASPNSPVTLAAGAGVNENVYVSRTSGGREYRLSVVVAGPNPDDVTLTMPGVTLTRQGTSNVWTATGTNAMLGLITARAPMLRTETYNVTAGSYVDRVAFVVITLDAPGALVRFHFDGQTVDVFVELGEPIDPTQVPVPATRYGSVSGIPGLRATPGQMHMGWFEEIFPQMHFIDNPNRATRFDLTQTITEAMINNIFDDGILNLYASWLYFGDVNGDGLVNHVDMSLYSSFMGASITLNQIIRETADVNVDGIVNHVDISLMSDFMAARPVILGHRP